MTDLSQSMMDMSMAHDSDLLLKEIDDDMLERQTNAYMMRSTNILD